jgi:3D (Asp-Asp-Asp) domain-containing protein
MICLVTGYCRCSTCCGKTDGITASGHPARAEHTVAVDPRYVPLGTRLRLEGLGERVAEDTGGSIRGRRLDVFFPTHQQAQAFGRRWLKVEILPARAEQPTR